MPLEQLLGPVAALAGALVVIGALWRDHVRSDADDRNERDRWQSAALKLLDEIPGLSRAVAEQTKQIAEMDRRASQRTTEAVESLIRKLDK